MAKKTEPKPESEEEQLIKKIDQMLDPKLNAGEVKVPTSLEDIKLTPPDEELKTDLDTAPVLPDSEVGPDEVDPPVEPIKIEPSPKPKKAIKKVKAADEQTVAEHHLQPSQLDDPATDKAVNQIEIAESDRLLETDLGRRPTAEITQAKKSSLSEWLWLSLVLGLIVLGAAWLLLRPVQF